MPSRTFLLISRARKTAAAPRAVTAQVNSVASKACATGLKSRKNQSKPFSLPTMCISLSVSYLRGVSNASLKMVQLSVAEGPCETILVRGVNWIGDAVMTMPALRSLKRSHPAGSKISLLVKPWVSPLFEKDPHVDEVLIYQDEHKGLSGKLRLARELKKQHFCMAVLFQNAFDAAAVAFLSGIPERVGYNRDCRGFLLTKAVPFDDKAKTLHHIDYYQNLISKAGFPVITSRPWIYLSLEERLRARDTLKHLPRPVVGINPGAAYGSSKRWRPERFAAVIRRVISGMQGSAVIFGGPKETMIAEDILMQGGLDQAAPVLNLSGRTTVRELAALISECDLLVTNDSGPMHIGYAVGTPLVAIFGSTSPGLTGPPEKGSIVLRKALACSPCFERECGNKSMECMDRITSDEVFAAAKTLCPSRKAILLDRDGTLCRDPGYLSRMEDFSVFPEIVHLKRLRETGLSLIGISNQSGISRGIVQEEFVRHVNAVFLEQYGFEGFYYCPHHPDDHCSCRKPEPGLLMQARQEHHIDLKNSYVVGDKASDMLLAKAVGATGIFVRTGQESVSADADFTVADLAEVASLIERKEAQAHG